MRSLFLPLWPPVRLQAVHKDLGLSPSKVPFEKGVDYQIWNFESTSDHHGSQEQGKV